MTTARPVPSRKQGHPARCPACGHQPVAEVLYGMPAYNEQMQQDLEAGRVVLGGCCVSDDDPPWACASCNALISAQGAVVGTDESIQFFRRGPSEGRPRSR